MKYHSLMYWDTEGYIFNPLLILLTDHKYSLVANLTL